MSPQQLEQWARTRANGRKAFIARFTFVTTLVYVGSMLVIRSVISEVALSIGMAVGVVFYAVVMGFIAKALWHQSEAAYLKQTSSGA